MRIPRKRRQHHVWQHYLKSWATDDQIWCLRDGNTFCTNTINVAVDRDFYKLAALNPDDLVLIKWLVIDPVNSVGNLVPDDQITGAATLDGLLAKFAR